ncbi:MAG TPA: 50S ribosomal protein L21 [Candidatus Omnitrophota bacterium]|nr:50S ribosomal protein L21 [Candidatus Omnitrophota bacterium]HPS20747.1 50S ribosomal protein L21 [Candidatus Omnitrophota bacterium]
MYAIIELSGDQVKVAKGDVFQVNRLAGKQSGVIKVEKVLFGAKDSSSYAIGTPYVKGAYVECEVLGDRRGKKVIAFKYTPRKSSQTKRGHRQDLTELRVKDIHLG